ncbi:hypothetical protein KPL76_03465 [Subtercola sp. PAMC28395]|uniref:hypothetical protein n=1 Tax=Subtercola sp. PAMC28395 TaxID=2846775 RepID=UPI001C0E29E8|nr:hypothetical protein [Subtercola sp. PAMC28395]QWT24469.1 hypothetical protein KPL76_03465 [Subtercola sp. PAMC28395]
MVTSLASLISAPPSGRPHAVLLDSHDYAQAVLLQGKAVPWEEPMAYSNFFSQAQALLKPDVALLSLDRFVDYVLQHDAALKLAMSARSRTGFALRTLLADASLAERSTALASIFAKMQREPVVVVVPSPIKWLLLTHGFSSASGEVSVDADDAENASMYVADWLRAFSALPIAGVILDDRMPGAGIVPAPGPSAAVPLAAYTPIANVSDHYGWGLGLRSIDRVEFRGPETGAVIGQEFWLGDDDASDCGRDVAGTESEAGLLLVGEIPPSAVPETVLRRMAALGRHPV